MEFEYIKRSFPTTMFALSDADLQKKVRADKAAEMAREHVVEAMNTLLGLMRSSPDDRIRVKCAMTIIERAYGAPKQVDEGQAEANSIVEILARISTDASQPMKTINPVEEAIEGAPK